MVILTVLERGELEMDYEPPSTNADAFSIAAFSRLSKVMAEASNCTPLRMRLRAIVGGLVGNEGSREIEEINQFVDGATKADRRKLLSGVNDWLRERPDLEYADHFNIPSSATKAAFEYFQAFKPFDLIRAGVKLVDGEGPAHDVQYAILTHDVETANLLARFRDAPYRFMRAGGGLSVHDQAPLTATSSRWDQGLAKYSNIVPLEVCLARLQRSARVAKELSKKLGAAQARKAREMFATGSLEGDLGSEAHDLLSDLIRNEASHARQYWGARSYGAFPIGVMVFEGVYFVHAMEHDPVKYFLTETDACDCKPAWNYDQVLGAIGAQI